MRITHVFSMALGALLCGLITISAMADPCGMVPPIYTGAGAPITRIGEQKTYVFFNKGVETMVIRPGFKGNVDEFGMLIPFPSVPEIRKVSDNIFPHVAAAIDPPEVIVDLRIRRLFKSATRRGGAEQNEKSKTDDDGLKFNEVRVVRQEAVGMYEVAVLEAGSPAALKKWLDDHKYVYPDGMEEPCKQYVEAKWCFVAVKTKVGQKKGVQPKPGLKKVRPSLPAGSTFDGSVQAMGFRFRVDRLVVPMRLSAFNKGKLRNIVYLLTDSPKRIRSIPEEYVVRQIRGRDLLRNVTRPLPLRIIGGTEADIPDWRRKNLKTQRDPTRFNGEAKNLFAADLLAIQSGKLSHAHEETEKVLLRIGERLTLRGAQIDKLNADAIAKDRDETLGKSIEGLKHLTLTVVDGDFPREILAKQNLSFSKYTMPAKRNKSEFYDATKNGPGGKKQGVLRLGKIDFEAADAERATQLAQKNRVEATQKSSAPVWWFSGLAAVVGIGLAFGFRRRRTARLFTIVAIGFSIGCFAAVAGAVEDEKTSLDKSPQDLIKQLSDAKKVDAAVAALTKQAVASSDARKEIVGLLSKEASDGKDIAKRGWAIVALADIGGDGVAELFTKLHNDAKQPPLIRTWAIAARVDLTDSTEELLELAKSIPQFPAIGRPVGKKLVAQFSKSGTEITAEDILAATIRVPQLQQALGETILAMGSKKLVVALLTAKDQNVRRQAAGYLGALAGKGDKTVAAEVISAYTFSPDASDVTWKGGPLFLPGIAWSQADSRKLVGNLIAWHLWCDRHKRSAEQTQIHNNIRGVGLARAAGYQSPGFGKGVTTQTWLLAWGRVVGRAGIETMLKQQGVEKDPAYTGVLQQLTAG